MIDPTRLLSDLQRLLRTLEADLLERSNSSEVPEVGQTLQAEYQKAKAAERTSQSYEEWRSDYITQIAAAWVLSCVFVRFLEDNRLVEPPKIAGPGEQLGRARDEHELYFRAHPTETDREYLLRVFSELATLSGAKDVFGEHNPIHELPHWLSGDAAGELLKFFQKIDANTGVLVHDFTDPNWDTRFLGDLYQDLSEAARKKYALLQTPEFVEEFILDRTLDPAIEEFGLEGLRMIDPACGSGHFLLGSFHRIVERWQRKEPGTNVRVLVQRALDSVHGVDVNPYAVAIARFRLLLAALRECGIHRLQDAPDFHFNLAVGDSLLHGVRGREQQVMHFHELAHHYQSEDLPALQRTLVSGAYHAVVANPPYITPKDKALNEAYRERYSTCHRQYSLAVPFMERIFGLAVTGGFTGQITANSFMKREFGKKLIEEFLPQVDLTHIIDTSLAYVPGHGTPTVILLGRNRLPVSAVVRTVMGIKREDERPTNPAKGKVWTSILSHIDRLSLEDEFVNVVDAPRARFHQHPWSIGGSDAGELKERLDRERKQILEKIVAGKKRKQLGRTTVVGEDDAWILDRATAHRKRVWNRCVPFVIGDSVRDWTLADVPYAIYPYKSLGGDVIAGSDFVVCRHLAPYRTILQRRTVFGKSLADTGRSWWEHLEHYRDKLKTPLSIVFAFVATHNHFTLDQGGKIFKQSAPVIKLPTSASEEEHLAILGLLNSSTACFWMRQTFHDKGGGGIGGGIAAETWERFLEYDATKLKQFPLPPEYLSAYASKLDSYGKHLEKQLPEEVCRGRSSSISIHAFKDSEMRHHRILHQMISLQEELDWNCYRLYGLIDENLIYGKEPPPIQLGQRAFEIVMARSHSAGELETTWFERHGSTPITEIPTEWPDDYKRLIERRIEMIEADRNIGLIEQPEYKRRWNTEPWDSQLERALRTWLLGQMESYFDFDGRMNDEGKSTAKLDIALVSAARLADVARQDADFMQVGELYRDDPAFDVQKLVEELVEAESVPLLPVLLYKDTGLRKRAEWERTWELQREEDRLMPRRQDTKEKEQELSAPAPWREIPIPPKYISIDFQSSTYWRLRGKLDVPKERWVSFPHCEGDDGTLMIAWAGYDHLQLARAISAYYVEVQERLGGRDDPRLVPLLACLIDLLPWLKQWHNDVDPEFGLPMGDYFEGFIQEEARQMGKTLDQLKAWEPAKKTARRKRS